MARMHCTVALSCLAVAYAALNADVVFGAPRTAVPAVVDERAKIRSLHDLSIESLRRRSYVARFRFEALLGDESGKSTYARANGPPYYRTYMASYQSDGLTVYARIDRPPPSVAVPVAGSPVILFAHGWVGEGAAPRFDFGFAAGSYYGDLIDRYVKAGYVVITPGYRGHGVVNKIPAGGLEFIHAYDNGSYLAPIFYAIDLLHALQAVDSLNESGGNAAFHVRVDVRRIYLTGHSQGGDAAFTALAVSSSPTLRLHFAAASIWAGCIAGRMEQGAFYGPMETSMAAMNDPAYFPLMPAAWNPKNYSGTIQDGINGRRTEMYQTVRRHVRDQSHADSNTNSLLPVMSAIDAVRFPQYIDVPLDLHFSDSDYFSTPAWNAAVVRSIREAGGRANAYVYPGNSHEFRTVDGWSPAGSSAGRESALTRTLALFR